MSVIEVRSLCKTYGGRFRWGRVVQALRGVSLSVDSGQIFGLLGPNGAGKSTLVKILLGIARATSGEASLLGRPSGRARARAAVGYQPEDVRLPDYHSAASLLRFYGGLCAMSGAGLERRIQEVLQTVDLWDRRREKIRGYSKGMRQRLALAQAFLHRPKILFLDEPTDGLDPLGRARVKDLILDFKREGGTVFLNSHLLSEVEVVCDRVAILRRGEVAAQGTVEELTLRGEEYEIFLVGGWTEDLARTLSGLAISCAYSAEPKPLLRVRVAAQEKLDAVVDLLRSRGVGIRGISPRRSSLEEVFLSLVQ